jgi:ATP-dependent DNA helicase RecG
MVIENPEMFGLAQLHQLRGRVGRGEKQSYCFLSLNTEISVEAVNRLEYFTSTNDGLAIAEYDLSRRGPGEVYGTKQSGIPKLKIATLKNLEMIKKSRSLAEKAYNTGIKSINLFR